MVGLARSWRAAMGVRSSRPRPWGRCLMASMREMFRSVSYCATAILVWVELHLNLQRTPQFLAAELNLADLDS